MGSIKLPVASFDRKLTHMFSIGLSSNHFHAIGFLKSGTAPFNACVRHSVEPNRPCLGQGSGTNRGMGYSATLG